MLNSVLYQPYLSKFIYLVYAIKHYTASLSTAGGTCPLVFGGKARLKCVHSAATPIIIQQCWNSNNNKKSTPNQDTLHWNPNSYQAAELPAEEDAHSNRWLSVLLSFHGAHKQWRRAQWKQMCRSKAIFCSTRRRANWATMLCREICQSIFFHELWKWHNWN